MEWDILVNRSKEKKTFYVCLKLRSLEVKAFGERTLFFISLIPSRLLKTDIRLTVPCAPSFRHTVQGPACR